MAGPDGEATPEEDGRPGVLAWLRSLLLWLGLALLLRWQVLEPRWIPSGSMLPSLNLQDRVLVEKLSPHRSRPPPPGSVVVFRPPDALVDAGYDPTSALIKRVVAVAGDEVAVRDGALVRNGTICAEAWLQEPMRYELAPVIIPEGNILVLGDNRNASLDSHLWGPLPSQRIIGRAIWRYWPLRRFGPVAVRDGCPAAS
ncbi:signal peptidase I [Synechococcus sp. RSCCF101]|uniref:signal peptidase I n=1 Tax=Synechococcus sp. RSCCF101 TaxID=2511069 RepID=UPI0012469C2A|nr:signal peptidase I [Synechococcus sp. RSCCF101]QEY31452.1 signal peptidase I [Synechococcus sp. RSCCF101]